MGRLLAFVTALLSGCMTAAAETEGTFKLELSGGYINGAGMDDPSGLERRIPGNEDGRRRRLDGRWQPGDRWYLLATAEQATLSYENPANPGCPVHAGRIPVSTFACSLERFERDGRIDDELDHARLGVGWSMPFGDSLLAQLEGGYGYIRWDSTDDYEITAATRCLVWSGTNAAVTGPRVDCTPVETRATDGGLFGRVGLEWALGTRFKLGASAHHQRYRYRVYRNEVVPRIAAANCERVDLCGPVFDRWVDLHATDTTGDSWTWYSVRADLALDRRWGVFLSLEGGGNRDWTTADLGVRLGF
jgi:hypothetical protein